MNLKAASLPTLNKLQAYTRNSGKPTYHMIEAAKQGTLSDHSKKGVKARFSTKTISPEFLNRRNIIGGSKPNSHSQSVLVNMITAAHPESGRLESPSLTKDIANTQRTLKQIIETENKITNRGLYLAREHDKQQTKMNSMLTRIKQRTEVVKQKEEKSVRLAMLKTREEA